MPYHPVSIHAVKDALNIDEYGEGDYEINRDITFEQCLQAIDDITSRSIPIEEISADMVRKELQGKQKTV